MSLRFGNLYTEGYYHIFNRGVDKRVTFRGNFDVVRFLLLLQVVNTAKPIQSIQKILQGNFDAKLKEIHDDQLVEILAIAIVKNHYHLIVRQLQEEGVSKFMQKLGTGYTMYFNAANERTGALFQGKYKYIEIKNQQQLMRLIAYVSRNNEIHDARVNAVKGGVWTSHKDILTSSKNYIDTSKVQSLFGGIAAYRVLSKEVNEDVKKQRAKKETYDADFLE